ncbi:hypothetical protein GN956_G21181 [Arapaima gigas]
MSPPAKSRVEKGRAFSTSMPPSLPGPVKVVEPVDIIPGRLSKAEWLAMVEQEEGEEVVADIIHELMQRVMEKCYTVYLERQLIPFVVSCARDTLVQLVGYLFPGKDEGDGPDVTFLCEEDSEPQPCSTDSWAQGCVPVVQAKMPPCTPEQLGSFEHTSCKKTDSGEPQGVADIQSAVLLPAPPQERAKRRAKVLLRRVVQPVPKVPVSLPRIPGSPSSSVKLKEEAPFPKDEQGKAKTLPKPSDARVVRLDPGHHRKQLVWPGFEVLESNVSQQPPQKVKSSSIPRSKLEKRHSSRLVCQGAHRLSGDAQTARQKSSSDAGRLPLPSSARGQEEVKPQQWIPPTSMLLLDSMELSPGVVLRDPLNATSSSYRRLHQPDHRQNLKPIRSSVPTPLLSVDKIILGQPSCVPSLTSGQDNLKPKD